jgi:hypothetical protein
MWKAQFDRMLRTLSKVEQRNADPTVQLDDLYHFFQDCWHLKDWIKNDDTLSQATRDAIVKEAERTESLKFCAELAIESKHLVLKHPRKEKKGATLWRWDITQKTSNPNSATVARRSPNDKLPKDDCTSSEAILRTSQYVIATQHGTLPPGGMVGFARKAAQDWKDLLNNHALDTSAAPPAA